MATKTTWWDKNGDVHEGWIKDGKTYMDEAGTARVPTGATVQTNGGTFKMTENGGIPTQDTARNQYENKSNAAINAYKAAGQVQQDRIKSATTAAIAEMNRQKNLAQQNRKDADTAAKEAYRQAANPFGALEEKRVRLGLDNSGYSESSKLKLASAYANQVNENLRAMNDQLAEIDVQIAQAKASGQNELANMLEARAQNIMQQEIALQSNLYSGDMQAIGQDESSRRFNEQMAENTRQFNEQMAAQKAQAEQQNKWDLALAFVENGKNASFIAETLGIPQADVNTLIAAVNAQNKVRASGGGSGSKKPDKPVLTFAQVNEAIENGNITPNVLSAYQYYYGENYGSNDGVNKNAQGINYGSEYNTVYANLRNIEKNGGSREQAIRLLQTAIDSGTLTDAGYLKLEEYFKTLLGA